MTRSGTALLICILLAPPIAAQSDGEAGPQSAAVSSDWQMPRTEWGHPDLQGTWFFGSRTPLQRPVNLGTKQTYTELEAAELEAGFRTRLEQQDAPLDPQRAAPEKGAQIRQEADDTFLGHLLKPELDPVNGQYRTSVIIDPPDGRLPVREGFRDYHQELRAAGLSDTDGPEGQPLSGRCLTFGAAVPSLTPVMMNPNMLIVQNHGYVMIMTEMIHDARIIRLGEPRPDNGIRQWMGVSSGRWEGDTLVVTTTNFRPEQSAAMFVPLSEDFTLEERYTLAADDRILYAFTFTDAQAYTRPVSGERILNRNAPEELVYEYACHEGNYSLPGILAGARRQEVYGQ